MYSSLVMVAEPGRIGRKLSLSGVPNVLWVELLVRVLLDGVVGVSAHEESVQRGLFPGSATLGNVLAVLHSLCGQVILFLDHGGVRLKVGTVVPLVARSERGIGRVAGEAVAKGEGRDDGVPSEGGAGDSARVGLGEIPDIPVQGDDRHSHRSGLESAAD